MLSSRPAHPLLASVGFGWSLTCATRLLPVDRPFEQDPFMLPVIVIAASIAGAMLLYAIGWRLLATVTSILAAACFLAIYARIQRGLWSGPPLPLLPIGLSAVLSWIPQTRPPMAIVSPARPARRQGRWADLRAGPTLGRPVPAVTTAWDQAHVVLGPRRIRTSAQGQMTRLLGDRWLLLGREWLPGADPSGHSEVHLALDTWNDHQRVVAKLPSDLLPGQTQARLAREAQLLLAARGNPHVVSLLDSGHDRASGVFFLILAYHPQGSLAHLLITVNDFDVGWATHVTTGILRGLIGLQEDAGRPIVHRDLNPRNVLLCGDRATPVICDLSMARRIPAKSFDDTITTVPVFSPWYAAPELVREGLVWGLETDSYGVGAILYELTTGQPPFRRESQRFRESFTVLVRAGVRIANPQDLNPSLPTRLADLIDRCLSMNPADRPATAADVLRDLERASRGHKELPIPFATLRHRGGPAGHRSA
jgi:Protein kinase domain